MDADVAALIGTVAAIEARRVDLVLGGRTELRDLRRLLHARFTFGECAVLHDEKCGAHQCPYRGVSYDSVVHGCTFIFVSAAGLGELRAAGRGALPAVGPVPVAERIAVVGPALLRRSGVAARVAWGGLRGGRLRGDEGEDGEGSGQGLPWASWSPGG